MASHDEDSSSESNSDSDSASDEGQSKQQIIEETTQKPPKKFTMSMDGKEKKVSTKLFVGNLDLTTEEKALEQAFVQFGEPRSVHIVTSAHDGHSLGCGYVEFTTPESAAMAFQARTGFMLDGRDLHLDFEFSGPHRGSTDMLNQDQQNEVAQHQTDTRSHIPDGTANCGSNGVNTNEIVKDQISSIDSNTNCNQEKDDMNDAGIRIHTANLVIDELVQFANTLEGLPGFLISKIVYNCTPTGSPLRALFRDWYIHEVNPISPQLDGTRYFHVELLKDVVVEMHRISDENSDRKVKHLFRSKTIDRPTGHYHQKLDRSKSDNRA